MKDQCANCRRPIPAGATRLKVFIADAKHKIAGAWCMVCASVAQSQYAASLGPAKPPAPGESA